MTMTMTSEYINNLKINGDEVCIFLRSGIRLKGVIEAADAESIIFISGQLVARSAIATIQASD